MTREPRAILSRIFRRLLPGPLGEEARAELEEGYRQRQNKSGTAYAWIWYAGHLLHPDTWRLALALRRAGTRRQTVAARALGSARTRIGAPISRLDFKIAYRMLIKHPGLTVTAGLAIAFAVTLAAVSFEFFTDVFYPTLPVDEPRELVEIRNRNIRTPAFHTRALDDFELWRDAMRSVEEVGAFETSRRILRARDGAAATLWGASMTAAAFQVARVPPLMGRGLAASDEVVGAPRVVVISYHVWQSLFAGDVDVVGESVHVESEPATVIGVMPEGFRFPTYHDLWEPLRYTAADFAPGEGPAIQVVARLAPGSSLRAAQAELTGIGLRAAADDPATHEHLRPEVVPYGRIPLPAPDALIAASYWASILFFALILVLVYGNVALLLFARTAARAREIVVRSALGASRARIVAQLAAEALVLAGGAAVVGLAAAEMGLDLLVGVVRDLQAGGSYYGGMVAFGYWVAGRISPLTAVYTLALVVTGAVASGVIPALKLTGRGGRSRQQRLGAPGPEFGRLWSGIIVTQIAATVAFVPHLVGMGIATRAVHDAGFGFPAAEYLSVRLRTDRGPIPGLSLAESWEERSARYLASVSTLEQRLEAELGVDAVTAASQIPGAYHRTLPVEVDGVMAPVPSASRHRVRPVSVDPDFFDALRTPIVSGRGFHPSDVESSDGVVVVNEDFARVVLGGRSPIGRRLRYVDRRSGEAEGPAYAIVGVAKQIAMTIDPPEPAAGVYHPLRRAGAEFYLIMRIGSNAASFAPRLEALATEVAPALQLLDVRTLDDAAWDKELSHAAMFWLMLVAGGLAVLLSMASIYAILSFSVSRRTREIGVRVALGATRFQVASTVLSRLSWQITFGVLAGGVMSLLVYPPPLTAAFAGLFGGYLTAMICVCLLACLVPTSRALRIEPTQALKEEV